MNADYNLSLRNGLFDPVSKLVHVDPFPGLLVDEFSPFCVLGDQSFVESRVILGPGLLSDNIRDLMSLACQDFLAFHSWVEIQVLRFDDQRRLLELMQWWRRGKGEFQGVGNQRDYYILSWGQFVVRQLHSGRRDRPTGYCE